MSFVPATRPFMGHTILAACAVLALIANAAEAASPKGPESGLMNQVQAIDGEGESLRQSDEYGSVRGIPPVKPEAVLPVQMAEDGTRFTLVRYSDPQSAAVRLHFRNMHLSDSTRVYVYGIGGEGNAADVYGPFTGAGPVQTGEFWTPTIRGTQAIVEVQFDGPIPSDLPFDVVEIGSLDPDGLARNPARPQTADPAPRDVRRSLYQGVAVSHEVRDGMAVFEGDIILGRADQLEPAPLTNSKSAGKESTATSWLSARWPKGVMPYVIDPALPNPSRVTDAVAQWNTALNGIINIVPRTTQANYVSFTYSSNASYCASSVGMTGGLQDTYLGDYCSTGNIVHEIGHDLGLWHEHTRNDRNTYVNILTQNITPSALGNFSQNGANGIDLGTYDYNSIMHYPAYAFSANGNVTIQTIPDGIPIGQRAGLSTGDIGGVAQIYAGQAPPAIITESVISNPTGIQLQVDGATVTSPYSAQWTSGSTHTVSGPSPPPANGQKLVFASWSDGGAQTHTVTTGTSNSVLTANYAVSYLLSTQVSPAGSGSVSMSVSSPDGYYAANTTITVTANPATGYCFSSWTGLLSGTPNQTSITMTKAYSLVANFVNCAPPPSQTSFTPIRVNAGSSTSYTDPSGNVWSADMGFTTGYPYSTAYSVANTNAPALYQTERYATGTLQYVFNVPNGTYTVNLKFAEIYFSVCGQRVFNILINGQTMTANFDPCAAAGGSNIAVDRPYTVSVTNSQVNIQLIPVANNPKISAIEILAGTQSTTPPTTTTQSFSPIRINAGASSAYTDSSGNFWSADKGFTTGYTYATGSAIANSTDGPLYQTERYATGPVQYVFTVPNGTYTVNLKFAEIYYTTCGQRVFNIVINGQTVGTNFDPCAAAGGWNRAVDKPFTILVTTGQINIQLVPVIANPKISAIEILAAGTAPPPTSTFTPIRLNAGGPTITDAAGQVWSADYGYSANGGGPYATTIPTSNTTTPALYQSERYSLGPLQYQFTVPAGTYTLTLKFAEIYFTTCGQRAFTIAINGQTQITNFDPCAAAGGPNIAIDRQFTVTSAGQVTIQLLPVLNNPKISAIEIR